MMPGIFTLSRAGESMVITDPKGELFERTSGYLKENGYKVYCVNFRDGNRQNSWNPLEIPRRFFSMGKFDLAVGLLNDFAHISVPHSLRNNDPFWDDSARSAFMGMLLILMVLAENTDEVNIRSLLRLRSSLFNDRQHLSNHRENSLFSRIMDLIDEGFCYSVDQLAITGGNLMTEGLAQPGPSMSNLLDWLLHEVVEGRVENNKEALLNKAREWQAK